MEGIPPIPILLGAAVVDSINPCAFGVLIFLLTYLSKTSKRGIKLLTHGLSYILAVFLTYLLAGILLMPVIGSLGQISVAFYGVIGVVIILLGLVEIKDFFWYQKGFSLELLPGAPKRIKMYMRHISGNIFTAFMLGVFVALVELPCTGAVYLAVLSIMSLTGVNALTISWLVIYNIIFVLPLIGILFAFYKGTTADTLESWRKKNRKWMRLLIGGILIFLGGWMIQTAYL
jgi:cytochrome c biogenesis protein CcdA